MKTYAECLDEFRNASAEVRRLFGINATARENQILANSVAAMASRDLIAAQERLQAADDALQTARSEPPAPADIDASKGVAPAADAAAANPYALNGAAHDEPLAIG